MKEAIREKGVTDAMQGMWMTVQQSFLKTHRKSIRMQRKLLWYWSGMLLVVLFIFFVVLNITGAFSALDEKVQQILSVRQKNVAADLSAQFDKIAAQGVAVSEQASALISNHLFPESIDALNDDPERIEEIESLLYGYLSTALRSAPCSGAYLVLDTTTNTQAPGAQTSRAGLYIRLTNLSSSGTANQDLVFYRGVPNVAREHQLELHNRWKLEFDVSKLPGYDKMFDRRKGRLAENAAWTERICLTDTWENGMHLMVPIQGNDGSVLGVCGLELSELYFMLSYPPEESNFGSMVTLLAPLEGDTLLLSQALSGRLEETYLNTEEVLQVQEGKYFNRYTGSAQTFLGVHTKVDLRTADGSQLYAVTLVPQDTYLRANILERAFWIIGTIAVLWVLLILSMGFSQSFVRPISQSLELLQNGGALREECSGVSEIEELFAFIQSKMQTTGSQLPPSVEELFCSLAQRATSLTPTEHNILKYYADGKGISEVAEQACISINTVRRHNANIYQKLGVSSREELLLYIELFRRCDRLDQLL